MITEDFVSIEIVKLFKEKGFNEKTHFYYHKGFNELQHCFELCFDDDFDKNNEELSKRNDGINYSAPTLQTAMKWLREVHNIFIQVDYIWSPKELYMYTFDIHNMKNARSIFLTPCGESFNSYEEAVEAAIKYCLTNLI